MAWTDTRIRARLQFLEREASEHPRRHALRLAGLAALGYLYPLFLLALSLFLVVLLLALPSLMSTVHDPRIWILYAAALIGALALSAGVLRTLFVRLPKPEGTPLRPNEASALREMIEEVRAKMNAPKIHELLVDINLNAAVAQRRRFGLWGPRRNWLIVGLPLLATTTPDQFRAVLAHELGHVYGQHGDFGAWIYRLHLTWHTLAAPFRAAGKIRYIVMGWFVRWFGSYFATSTLALRRKHEYEADRRCADLVGAEGAGGALVAIDWIGYRLSRTFWPTILREAATEPLPPTDILGRMVQLLATPPDTASASRWLDREKRCRTPITSEHPALHDRLQAINQLHQLNVGAATCCTPDNALVLLGDARERLWKTANALWKGQIINHWRHEHAIADHLREQLAKPQPPSPELRPGDNEWEQCQLSQRLATPEGALATLREFLSRYPNHPNANFVLGRMLLAQDDETAVPILERAMAHGSETIGPSLHLLLDHYRELGLDEQADPLRQRLEVHEKAMTESQKERGSVRRGDKFLPHNLPPHDVERIRRIVFQYPQVQIAYFARKEVSLFSDLPSYVLGITRRRSLMEENKNIDKWLASNLAAQIHVPCAVVILRWRNAGIHRRLKKVCPIPIFVSK
ncbi:MAG TPA: M48 family metallopeptidase [Tepidisphaeraceae bacterium]|jgi:Zn-dependent protease with chaperone function